MKRNIISIFVSIILAILVFLYLNCFSGQMDTRYPGLVGLWHLNEGTGTGAADSLGLSSGTIIGATWISGLRGSALSLSGNNQYIFVGERENLKITGDVTLLAWLNRTDRTNYHMVVATQYGPAGGTKYNCYEIYIPLNSNVIRFVSASATTSQSLDSNTGITSGIWYMIAVTREVKTIKFYVNGKSDGTQTTTITAATTAGSITQIAKRSASNDYWFKGKIDEVAIFNRALSQGEIQKIYLSGIGRHINTQ